METRSLKTSGLGRGVLRIGAMNFGKPEVGRRFGPLIFVAGLFSCVGKGNVGTDTTNTSAIVPIAVSPEIRALLDAPDRDSEDRKLDAGRKPGEMLSFFGVKPGMKVAELGAGLGYTTELLARAVGPTGIVYGQNDERILQRFADKTWSRRLLKPVNNNVVKVTREFEDPLPPEANDLDAVFVVLLYHDTYWWGTDRAKMNAAVFRALKSGGVYAVMDHSGRPGSGATEVRSIHRIEESTLKQDILKAGFELAGEGEFMRNRNDTRDWNASKAAAGERRGTSDRFALKFVKP